MGVNDNSTIAIVALLVTLLIIGLIAIMAPTGLGPMPMDERIEKRRFSAAVRADDHHNFSGFWDACYFEISETLKALHVYALHLH